ncbi:hypothetical protein [uncultured Sphingomonas sp.]|uniref:hypothetical protein n=1 Tax=uncultured Sphingomonas sp. TaxID=158754 RepID=UPI0026392AC3|nr:hypothetical protein [uncultured Sphingomonas sp.]
MKAGSKLKSAVDDTEVMVIKAPAGGTVSCGGAPMGDDKPAKKAEIDPAHADGTKMGKRYTDAAGTIELLCIKPGKGSLALDGVALLLKDAKPLPSSD